MAEQWSTMYKYQIFFIHLSFDGHTYYIQDLAIVNCAAINMGMYDLLLCDVFNSWEETEKERAE